MLIRSFYRLGLFVFLGTLSWIPVHAEAEPSLYVDRVDVNVVNVDVYVTDKDAFTSFLVSERADGQGGIPYLPKTARHHEVDCLIWHDA